MAKDKKSFILYLDQRGIFEKLTNEQAGKLIKHIYSYCSDEDPETDFVTELAFEAIKQALKRDLRKFEVIKVKRSEAGRKSAEKRAQQKATNSTSVKSVEQTLTNPTVSVNDNVSVSDINKIYSLYPSKCVVKNSSTGKSRKTNVEQIKRLLKTHSVADLKTIIERYVTECRKDQVFMKNFKTFLNNLPDYETKEIESKYLPPIDKLVAHVALQVPTEKQKLLDKGYSIEQIKHYSK